MGWKSVFETYRLPLAWFVDRAPSLDLTHLEAVVVDTDITLIGHILVDDVEFASPPR